MRLMITYLDRQGVRVLAPVHDGFLLSCRRGQLPDLREAVEYARHCAVEHVLPGFPLRCDVNDYDGRFEDEDGLPLWNRLQEIVKELEYASATLLTGRRERQTARPAGSGSGVRSLAGVVDGHGPLPPGLAPAIALAGLPGRAGHHRALRRPTKAAERR